VINAAKGAFLHVQSLSSVFPCFHSVFGGLTPKTSDWETLIRAVKDARSRGSQVEKTSSISDKILTVNAETSDCH